MTKKILKKNVEEQMEGDFPAELGIALSALGEVLTAQWWEQNGVFLDKSERDVRNEPLASVGNMNIKIDTGYGKTFVLSPANEDEPSVVIPVGMSDKVTTATRPNDWIMSFLLACIQEMAQDDYITVSRIMDAINHHIDVATEVQDDKKKIVQSKLPAVKNAGMISGFLSSMKRTFTSRCRGSSRINLKMDLVNTTTNVSKPLDFNEVVVPKLQPTTIIREGKAPVKDVVKNVVEIKPDIDVDVMLSRRVLESQIKASIEGESTIGMIRKSMVQFGVDEAVWRPRLDAMVKSGNVQTNGLDRRAKRYIVESKEVKA